MARIASISGDPETQKEWLGVALEADKNNVDVAAELAELALEMEDDETALKALTNQSLSGILALQGERHGTTTSTARRSGASALLTSPTPAATEASPDGKRRKRLSCATSRTTATLGSSSSHATT